MAKKSKTQKAKAAAARAARKAAKANAEEQEKIEASSGKAEESKKIFKKKEAPKQEKTAAQIRQERRDAKMAAKENKKPKKHGRFIQFFIDVKAELKRVTWPDRKDVGQWTGVVIGALVFFGVYVFVLDNLIVTPVLLWIANFSS